MSRWEWVFAAILYIGMLCVLSLAALFFAWLWGGDLALSVASLALAGSALVMLRQIIYEDRHR